MGHGGLIWSGASATACASAAFGSYSDRYTSSFMAIHESSVQDMFFEYIKPQESGNRAEVRWVSVAENTTYGRCTARGGGACARATAPCGPGKSDRGAARTSPTFVDAAVPGVV